MLTTCTAVKCSGESTGCKACASRCVLHPFNDPRTPPETELTAGPATESSLASLKLQRPWVGLRRLGLDTSLHPSADRRPSKRRAIIAEQVWQAPPRRPSRVSEVRWLKWRVSGALVVLYSSLTPSSAESSDTKGYSSRKVPRVTLDNVLSESLSKLRIIPFKTTFDAFSTDSLGVMIHAFYGSV